MRPDRKRKPATLIAAAALGATLASAPARADMRVLSSNDPAYPRDLVVKGDTILNLAPGHWVKVLMLEDKTTRTFGTLPKSPEQNLGTRQPK
jgi:hypothetical protein